MSFRIGLALVLIFGTANISADVHRWVDENGRVHFGDRPPADVETTTIDLKINTYESPSIEGLANVVNEPDKVVMYTTSWCSVCKRARNYLTAEGIEFSEYDIEKSRKGKREFDRLGGKGVPVILVGKQRMNGFSKEKFAQLYAMD